MPKFRAALFDFDGVIVDSTPIHLEGWAYAYNDLFGMELDSESLKHLVGRSTSAIGRMLAEQRGYPAAKSELIKRKVHYLSLNIEKIPLIPGALEFLGLLSSVGIPFGIVSNAPRDFIRDCIEMHRIEIPFFLGLEDYRRPKPDAEPYMKGAMRMGGFTFPEHKDIFVFEDSTHGLHAAISAHMTAIGVCSQHPQDILLEAGASDCIQDLREARRLILK